MKLYASSTLLWGKCIHDIGAMVSHESLDGIELWAEQIWHSKMNVRDIKRVLKKYNLEVSFHAASWDLNICSLNEGIRKQSIDEVIRSFALAASIGATNVTVHPGKRTLSKDWTLWHIRMLEESLDVLEEAAATYGITLSLELMENEKKEFVTSAQQMTPFIFNRSEHVQTTFDAAHIALNKNIVEEFQQMIRVNKIHLSDSTASIYHVALGEGDLDLEPFLTLIKGVELPVVLEGYDTSEDCTLLKKHVQYMEAFIEKNVEEVIS
ncbi:sugar phosphate isomerase/epimerase [Bacillus sp. JCM 19034]|uniref:sugar phosphate isomerase/epimerase family protein n=1 Tax=Bacillus sp. JCM 19034 TaxID=1481928 RepID=UPI0007855D9D|nr:sugar phosphate isomerase/epimerase family protein [Bacillus sp. JCM 19034]